MNRSRRGPRIVILTVLLLAMAAPSRAEEMPLALLVGVKGGVQVTAANARKSERAVLGRPLMRGDRVRVKGFGSATLFFNDGNVIELGPKSNIVISSRTAALKPTVSGVPVEVFRSVSKNLVAGSRETGLVALPPMRGGAGGASPLIVSPRLGSVLDDRPGFAWRPVEGAVRYRITLNDEKGELWRRETDATALAYPPDVAPLARGAELLWEVAALGNDGPIRQEETSFTVTSAGETEMVRAQVSRLLDAEDGPAPEIARYLAGMYLAGHGAYGEAIEQFRTLCELTPKAPEAHQALGNAYRAVGLNDWAWDEMAKALALERER